MNDVKIETKNETTGKTMPRVYAFDAYGTLFDVHSAIARHRATAGPDAAFSDIWRTKQLEYSWTLTLAGQYLDFWTLTERALDYAFARLPSVDRALRPKLLDAYFKLDAYADARATSKASRTEASPPPSCPTARRACSMPPCRRGLGNDVGRRAFSRAVRLYKPRPEVYAMITGRFGVKPAEVVFVSSNRWDVMGARQVRFSAALDQSQQYAGRISGAAAAADRDRPVGSRVVDFSVMLSAESDRPRDNRHRHRRLGNTGSGATAGSNCGATKRPCSMSSICRSICFMT